MREIATRERAGRERGGGRGGGRRANKGSLARLVQMLV